MADSSGPQERVSTLSSLTPIGALLFFILVVFSSYVFGPVMHFFNMERAAELMSMPGFGQVLILPLAYAFYPQVFTRRFWHFPPKSWLWLLGAVGFAGLQHVLRPVYPPPFGTLVAIGLVFVGPPLEEIVRAVMVSALLERWGRIVAILVTAALLAAAHRYPLLVVFPMLFLSTMLVFNRVSVLATTLAHAVINAFVVLGSGIRSGYN